MTDKKLNLIAPVGKTGYGVVGFNVLQTLVDTEWDVALMGRGGEINRSPVDTQMIKFAMDNCQFFHYDAPCLNVWHQFDLGTKLGRGKYVAWPIFELDTFDERERHHLGYPDELVVCSKWAKEVIEKNDIDTTVHVVPLGVDLSVFNVRGTPKREEGQPTIFLNAGKWEIRKGHDILGEAFNDAFTPEDNVELWLMPFNPFLSASDAKNWANLYLDTPMGKADKIKILPWQPDQRGVAKVMAQADCGVFPSRGEGWNLELLEMMALNKPVIATNYAAHTEFCDEFNCMLVDVDDVEPAYDGKWFFEQGNWGVIGEPQIEQMVSYMRRVHRKYQRAGVFTNDAGLDTARTLTWDEVGEKISEILLD